VKALRQVLPGDDPRVLQLDQADDHAVRLQPVQEPVPHGGEADEPILPEDLVRQRLRVEVRLSAELDEATAKASVDLHRRIQALPEVSEENRRRVVSHIEEGDLLTAGEMISYLSSGQAIPETGAGNVLLHRFFPAVPETLRQGVTADLVRAVRERRPWPDLDILDFSRLPAEFADGAANALDGWRQMRERRGSGRTEGLKETELLFPALRLIGYRSMRSPERLSRLRKGPDYRYLDLHRVEWQGHPLVPAGAADPVRRGEGVRGGPGRRPPLARLLLRADQRLRGAVMPQPCPHSGPPPPHSALIKELYACWEINSW
jgi:hypothetical protein